MPTDGLGALDHCFRCGKPMRPGAGVVVNGGRTHRRCLTRQTIERWIETQAVGQELTRTASAKIATSQHRIEQTAARVKCRHCEEPLSKGGGVLFEGTQLVHGRCWRDASRLPDAPAPEP